MRRSLSTLVTLALTLTGTFGLGAFTAHLSANPTTQTSTRLQPAEDSPRFNCIRHGNRQCGVSLDPTPNNGVRNVKRYVILFDRNGRPVDVVEFGSKAHRNLNR
jgi:hypothetical protein